MQKKFMLDIDKKNKEDIQDKENRKEILLTEALDYETEILNNDKEIDTKTIAVSDTQTLKTTITKVSTLKEKLSTKRKSHAKEKKFFEENDACPTCGQSIEEHFKQEKITLLSDKLAEVEKGVSDWARVPITRLSTHDKTRLSQIESL